MLFDLDGGAGGGGNDRCGPEMLDKHSHPGAGGCTAPDDDDSTKLHCTNNPSRPLPVRSNGGGADGYCSVQNHHRRPRCSRSHHSSGAVDVAEGCPWDGGPSFHWPSGGVAG